MASDIHFYVEYKDFDSWWPFGGAINVGRNYEIFGNMAGVRVDREPLVRLRGVPGDISVENFMQYWTYANPLYEEEKYGVSLETAKEWVEEHDSVYKTVGERLFVSNPDNHSPSWLTPDEFEACFVSVKDYRTIRYKAALAAMRSLEKDGLEVRCVFWFDN